MPNLPGKNTFFSKQIPTLVGLGVLVIGLVAGILFIGQGAGVFAPRATAETTPKLIHSSNITDTSFTVSFLTESETVGFINYGTDPDKLSQRASDDRDQISGSVGKFNLHHITVRGVEAGTTYYYSLGTSASGSFTNEGKPFSITTAKRGGNPTAAKTAYGTVLTEAGTPAENAIVYVTIEGVGEMSSLVKASGSWAVPLSNARTTDGSAYATITDTQAMTITVQGVQSSNQTKITTTVAESQPVSTITMGKGASMADASEKTTLNTITNASESAVTTATGSASTGTGTNFTDRSASSSGTTNTASGSAQTGGLTGLLSGSTASSSATTASASAKTVDLESDAPQIVTSTQPTITGQVPAGVKKIKVQVHSEQQYDFELVPDANGGFTLDLEKLKAQLEPGEHTITYSYTDPATGEEITKTQTFTVQPKNTSTQIAAATTSTASTSSNLAAAKKASPSPTPYSSSNPYSLSGASASASVSPSPKAASSSSSTSRTSMPSTASGVPVSGSVGTTVALVIGGMFLLLVGAWSWWAAKEFATEEME